MSITTKKGDQGQTRLFSGERVSKSDLAPRAYGDCDELVSYLGLIRAEWPTFPYTPALLDIQKTLFTLCSELATTAPKHSKLPQHITAETLATLETHCNTLETTITMPTTFVIPGGTRLGAHVDMARSMARRCERSIVALHTETPLPNPLVLAWINRLSDFLWLLARYAEEGSETGEKRG